MANLTDALHLGHFLYVWILKEQATKSLFPGEWNTARDLKRVPMIQTVTQTTTFFQTVLSPKQDQV